jgi:transcriptional regulator with XRE-family HTH domain
MDTYEHRDTLARNVRYLMDHSPDLSKAYKLAAAAGVGQATVDRLLSASAGVSVDSVAAVATALGVSPWVLFHPDKKIGQVEAEFYAKMRGVSRHK